MTSSPPADQDAPFVDRETSWLSFGHRVLQEAEDPAVPPLERLFFCGIFSSNLDEYFRVRVASLRSLLRMGDEGSFGIDPERLLDAIHDIVHAQQERYGDILEALWAELEDQGIHRVDDTTVPAKYDAWVRSYFEREVKSRILPLYFSPEVEGYPFLENRVVYLIVEVWPTAEEEREGTAPSFAVVEVPSPPLDRFVTLPGDVPTVMYLDDVIRYNLPSLFPDRRVGRAFAVKLTRDADLYLEDEFEGNLAEAIRNNLSKREIGVPSRFLYDPEAPPEMVATLQDGLGLADEDMVIGGRYHNLSDLMTFPRFGRDDLSYPDWPPLPHPVLPRAGTIFEAVQDRDHVVHTPYQSFENVVRFVQEAAKDPDVEELWITVYRVAWDSDVLTALLDAARAGKRVTAFIEVQARFDEESNLKWADAFEAAGVRTLYSIPGLKVHAKLALVARREEDGRRLYSFVGTGNFNEDTATVYADHGVFTSDERITTDVEQIFRFLSGEVEEPQFRHLLVAPFTMREGFYSLIEAETEAARKGRSSGMILKMNALEDEKIIRKVYEASRAGVPVQLIVRGICRLIPGVEGHSATISVRSILDRYLEHARMYVFHAGGEETMFLASADWMKRNLSRRVEVALPIYDPDVRRELQRFLDIQLADDRKARRLDGRGYNEYVEGDTGVRAQEAFRDYLSGLLENASA